MKHFYARRSLVFILVGCLALQLTPFWYGASAFADDGLSHSGIAAVEPSDVLADCFSLYMPSILSEHETRSAVPFRTGKWVTGQTLAGPGFEIINPQPGWTISGIASFAVQPNIGAAVSSVSFSAGETDLGTDSDPMDGFSTFIDTSQFADGPLMLQATVQSACGTTTQSIQVTVDGDPPTSAVIGEEGGTLASQIGSIITLPAGSVPNGTTVAVTEKSQEEITTDNGFEWDDFGVTFLGAQAVTATQEIGLPAMVASAGYANRIQPQQAVVNYRIMPDADGDGVDELVVVNSASVAGGDYVVSDPVPQIEVRTATSEEAGRVRIGQAPDATIQGPPGSIVSFDATGFNPLSPFGNLAIFESLVDSTVMTLTASIAPHPTDPDLQVVTTVIPLLPAGNAEVNLINLSTGSTFGPVDVLVESPLAPSSPAPGDTTLEFIDELEDATDAAIDQIQDGIDSGNPPVENAEDVIQDLQNSREALGTYRDYIEDLRSSPDPAASDALDAYDSMAEGSGFIGSFDPAGTLADIFSTASTGYGLVGDFLTIAGYLGFAVPPIGLALTVASVLYTVLASVLNGESFACTLASAVVSAIPLSTVAGQILSSLTGMGSVSPSGGAGCGAMAPFGGGDLRAADQVSLDDYTVIKLYASGSIRPFSAVVDKGGYFYMPIIPEGEPFIALAINTKTGDTRTYSGVGPAVGDSIFFKFDFNTEPEPIGTPIMVGDELSGTLNPEDPPLILSFTPDAGQTIFFESLIGGFATARWSLADLVGVNLFNSVIWQDEGPYTLDQSGQYLLTLTPDDDEVVDYHFKLWDVPEPERFEISIGQTISNGVPALGAGNIESPAAQDVYTFEAAADQNLYFEMIDRDGVTQIDWQVKDSNDQVVFQKSVFQGNQGVINMETGGTYTLTVGLDEEWGESGTYSFKIWNVPDPDQFAITIGDPVSNGVPAAGAGNLETPGVRDIYTFSVSAGQDLFIGRTDLEGLTQTDWQLLAPGDVEVFQSSLFSTNHYLPDLTGDGTYTLTVGLDETWGETGTYTLQIVNIPTPDQFAINVGDTVSDGVPGVGAGNIETPGAKDVYTFTATAGQNLLFDIISRDGPTQMDWRLVGPDDAEIFERSMFSGDQGPFAISQTGQYTLTVGLDEEWGESGTYSFSITNSP